MSDVLIRVEGVCGRITLNRPQALNALTGEMIREIHGALERWAHDLGVEFILIEGAGERGLCAGGDIRAMYDVIVAGDFVAAETFFRGEYELNGYIARYPKPYVALMDGIVMGGGIGVSAHGSLRVVTERSSLAMPEVGIGFIPDVGGTYLLSRAPGELGTYMGLTGSRIGAADAIACGLADVFVPGDRLPALAEALVKNGATELEECVRSFAEEAPAGDLAKWRGWIDACFQRSSVEAILEALEGRTEAEAHAAADEMGKKSPTSLKVALRALRRGREFGDLGRCLAQEYVLGRACARYGDFREGVRAALVDKDRKPVWRPGSLAEVTRERVDLFFEEAP